MRHNYSYQSALAASERIGWKVDDIIGGDKKLDFTKPFMPESLAQRKRTVNFLSDDEKRTLNQIRGLGYLIMFGLVEEFILPLRPRPRAAPVERQRLPCPGATPVRHRRGKAHPSLQALPAGVRAGLRRIHAR